MTSPAQPDQPHEQHSQHTRTSGALLFVLLCAMGVGPLFNYGISVSSALVIEQMGITAGQLGLVVTVVFASAAVSSMWLGRLADRMTPRAQLILIFLGTALALVVGAFAPTYWVLIIAAILAGPAQSISNPTTNRIIIEQVPPAKRSGVIGVKQSGVQASQLFSGLFFPAVALWLGWTGAALGAAALALVLLAGGLRVVPDSPQVTGRRRESGGRAAPGQQGPTTAPSPSASGAPGRLPTTVWIFAAIGMLSGFGMQATNVYLPLFAVEELGFSLVLGGVAAAASGVIGVISRIWWGRRMAAGWRPSTLLMMITSGAILGVAAFLGAAAWHAPVLIWVGAALHGITVLGANVVINAGLMQVVPAHRIGTASGVNSMGMYTGFALGPLVMGALRDGTGDFTVGWIIVAGVYVACVLTAVVLRAYGQRHPAARSQQG